MITGKYAYSLKIRASFLLLLVINTCFSQKFVTLSEKEFQDSLLKPLAISQPDTSRLNLLISIGDYYQTKHQDSALYYPQEGFQLVEKLLKSPENSKLENQVLLKIEKSLILKLMGWDNYLLFKYDTAIILYEKSLRLADSLMSYMNEKKSIKLPESSAFIDKLYMLKSASKGNIGIVYLIQGNYNAALTYNLEALKISEQFGYKEFTANHLGNIGVVYLQLKNYKKALDYLLQAVEVHKEIGNKYGEVNNLGNIGIAYKRLNAKNIALTYYFKALEIYEKLGDTRGRSTTLGNIGIIYLQIGKDVAIKQNISAKENQWYQKALTYCFKSLEDSKISNQKATLNSSLASVYMALEDFDQAEKYALDALRMANSFHSIDELQNAHLILSEIYEAKKRFELAHKHYKEHITYKDSIFNEKNNKAIIQKEMQFNFDKKQVADSIAFAKEKEIADVKLTQIKNQRYGFIAILVLSVLFIGVVVNRLKVTQKQRKFIQIQKESVEIQRNLVEKKNKSLTESIKYAFGIQQAMLITEDEIKTHFPESFIVYKPKDIVSGDFYWFAVVNGVYVFAVVDCTGHGVPGGFLTMLGNSLLNEIVNEEHILIPNEILNALNKKVFDTFQSKKIQGFSSDGMDIGVCCYNPITKILQFAGAKHQLQLINNTSSSIIKGDIWSIGAYSSIKELVDFEYKNNTLLIKDPTNIYLYTDGIVDQFGGDSRNKFGKKRVNNLLQDIQRLSFEKQKQKINDTLIEWKGPEEQIDDQLIFGIHLT